MLFTLYLKSYSLEAFGEYFLPDPKTNILSQCYAPAPHKAALIFWESIVKALNALLKTKRGTPQALAYLVKNPSAASAFLANFSVTCTPLSWARIDSKSWSYFGQGYRAEKDFISINIKLTRISSHTQKQLSDKAKTRGLLYSGSKNLLQNRLDIFELASLYPKTDLVGLIKEQGFSVDVRLTVGEIRREYVRLHESENGHHFSSSEMVTSSDSEKTEDDDDAAEIDSEEDEYSKGLLEDARQIKDLKKDLDDFEKARDVEIARLNQVHKEEVTKLSLSFDTQLLLHQNSTKSNAIHDSSERQRRSTGETKGTSSRTEEDYNYVETRASRSTQQANRSKAYH
jgi:hypothetical protein